MIETRAAPRARFGLLVGLCLLGLVIAAGAHASTFTPASLTPEHPLFWGLHVGIFPLFLPLVLRLKAFSTESTGLLGMRKSTLRWRALLPYFPRWAIWLGAVLMAYATINFLLVFGQLGGEGRIAVQGAMDPERARSTVRAFSGHWLVFYGVPMLFYLFVPADARPDDGSEVVA